MWKQIATVGAFAAALGLGPALAQQSPAPEPQEPAAQTQPMEGELVGLDVYSSDGQLLGKVTETAPAGDIHVDIGQFLGIGEKKVEVKSDQFERDGERINLTMTAEEARDLPEPMAQ